MEKILKTTWVYLGFKTNKNNLAYIKSNLIQFILKF